MFVHQYHNSIAVHSNQIIKHLSDQYFCHFEVSSRLDMQKFIKFVSTSKRYAFIHQLSVKSWPKTDFYNWYICEIPRQVPGKWALSRPVDWPQYNSDNTQVDHFPMKRSCSPFKLNFDLKYFVLDTLGILKWQQKWLSW